MNPILKRLIVGLIIPSLLIDPAMVSARGPVPEPRLSCSEAFSANALATPAISALHRISLRTALLGAILVGALPPFAAGQSPAFPVQLYHFHGDYYRAQLTHIVNPGNITEKFFEISHDLIFFEGVQNDEALYTIDIQLTDAEPGTLSAHLVRLSRDKETYVDLYEKKMPIERGRQTVRLHFVSDPIKDDNGPEAYDPRSDIGVYLSWEVPNRAPAFGFKVDKVEVTLNPHVPLRRPSPKKSLFTALVAAAGSALALLLPVWRLMDPIHLHAHSLPESIGYSALVAASTMAILYHLNDAFAIWRIGRSLKGPNRFIVADANGFRNWEYRHQPVLERAEHHEIVVHALSRQFKNPSFVRVIGFLEDLFIAPFVDPIASVLPPQRFLSPIIAITFSLLLWTANGLWGPPPQKHVNEAISTQQKAPNTAASQPLFYSNENDVKDPIDVQPASAVKRHFLSFKEMYELSQYDPRWGFYSAGKVAIGPGGAYTTAVAALSPAYGQAIGRQVFQIFELLRTSGQLDPSHPLILLELGGGDGRLARDLQNDALKHATNGDPRWKAFWEQTHYVISDISPALVQRQRETNAAFGDHFESIVGDATNPATFTRFKDSIVVVLGNELIDSFPVHKVRISPDGTAGAAFVVPYLPKDLKDIDTLQLPAALQRLLLSENALIQKDLTLPETGIFLSKRSLEAFMAHMTTLSPPGSQVAFIDQLRYHETYIPVRDVPGLTELLQPDLDQWAAALSRLPEGHTAVIYLNSGIRDFMRGLSALPRAYFMMQDYGEMTQTYFGPKDFPSSHFRTYPFSNPSPYAHLSFQDWTSDVFWPSLTRRAKEYGWSFDGLYPAEVLATATFNPIIEKEGQSFDQSLKRFNYQLVLMHKGASLPAFHFPGKISLQPEWSEEQLSSEQRERARHLKEQIEHRLRRVRRVIGKVWSGPLPQWARLGAQRPNHRRSNFHRSA